MTVESTSFPSELNKNVVIQKKEDMARDRGSWEIFKETQELFRFLQDSSQFYASVQNFY